MKKRITPEERVAVKIANLVNDVTIDLDKVGYYLANAMPTISYNRLVLLTEAAVEEKEYSYGRQFDRLFDEM